MEINESDLKIEFYRGSGPGGQHRNTTDSAVRIRHLPTGIVAHASESRSQLRNREVALERLKAALVRRDKKRKSRVPTTASRAEKERRLQAKKLTSRKKSLRKHVEDE